MIVLTRCGTEGLFIPKTIKLLLTRSQKFNKYLFIKAAPLRWMTESFLNLLPRRINISHIEHVFPFFLEGCTAGETEGTAESSAYQCVLRPACTEGRIYMNGAI